MKSVIETTTNGRIAAFIAEPIMGVGGFIDAPKEYFKRAHEIVKSFGGLYISDEVQTGVGRTGEGFFGIESSGVRPDFITCAKGLGSGAPIGACIARGDCADKMAGKLQFNTFGGDPYQTMQAGEVIDIVHDERLIDNARKVGGHLKEGLVSLQKEFQLIGDVRGRGLMLGAELVKDRRTKTHATDETVKLLNYAKDEGLLLGKGGLKGNVIRIAPPLTLTVEEGDEVILKLRKALQRL
jgi:4-aminobutyrate aminotransferase-like enzyme